MHRYSFIALAVTLALAATSATAQNNKGGGGSSGGVVAIDQAKAEAGGITANDTAGFPVTISEPGSYRLMSNLTVTGWATTGILITSPGVTLDLNGFEVRGPNTCTGGGQTLSCTSSALSGARGDGIRVDLPQGSPLSVAIENGSVRGFAGAGARSWTASWVYSANRLRVSQNGQYGLMTPALVADSVVDHNYMGGISSGMAVTRNVVSHNRGYGLYNSGIRHNASLFNSAGDDSNGYLN